MAVHFLNDDMKTLFIACAYFLATTKYLIVTLYLARATRVKTLIIRYPNMNIVKYLPNNTHVWVEKTQLFGWHSVCAHEAPDKIQALLGILKSTRKLSVQFFFTVWISFVSFWSITCHKCFHKRRQNVCDLIFHIIVVVMLCRFNFISCFIEFCLNRRCRRFCRLETRSFSESEWMVLTK